MISMKPRRTPLTIKGNQEPVSRGVQMLMDADSIIGHNILGYDIPVLDKFYPWYNRPDVVVDTLLLSRLYHADIMKLDQRRKWDQMPLQMYGRHSLEAYGYRLKCYKGHYGKTTDWKDVVTRDGRLLCTRCQCHYQTMAPLPPLPDWISLEHDVARILQDQELHGWYFNERACMGT